ncbi:YbaK/prolyl-tRNA synthetase associated domain-containing protein [Testudinibacter sp. TR-2022]|uniref:YbaK/prolyl-tRNA synthetase associated domain-containing protein n=1 Tax=Testudinibacter sp. TR-2022 TaxID=2585029 RepID=UPI00111891A0|nr:YbaK/prolyl-tRNA synthetase associated domain-containing protein [Testudinibacter sp. TR-2022]TNH05725.1 YbaK/prolyl-tRNA synthetase associated domain-containing protein [Pasteurellaceae bacterium Phil31]TNH10206.1 YbaK/prolyl-tRNA synthetase associated domain-containing protein [Testudinibacter sp. TR-2022]TNH11829.1 YbaK/prolyl-tRNA synthetase associated domain-containing protein [Testudinibacter sp. TR-2022]TNH12453.1 YbaK/prolyl-tRNA synthetase associated domain-containing protein [Testu
MSLATFQQLTALLHQQQARYRVVEHPACGKSEEVAKVRGTELGQGAKALLCVVKGQGTKQWVLAILPADKQADLSRLATALGGLRAALASPKEVSELTDCVFGAIPPFSFHPELKLVADRSLFNRYSELAFNAGTLESSIILNTEDYRRIADPQVLDFVQSAV